MSHPLSRILVVAMCVAGCREAPQAAPPPPAPVPVQLPVDVLIGGGLYERYCATCHGRDLEGYAADNAPSFLTTTWRETATPEFIAEAIERGRPGTAMAGYSRAVGGPLTPSDVASLVAFLRQGAPPLKALSRAPAMGDSANGQRIYESTCATCHGTPGQRGPGIHLANPALLAGVPDAFLRHAVEHGRPGTRMDGFATKLGPAAVEDVVTYVRSFARAVPPAPVPPPDPNPPQMPGQEPLLPITGSVVVNPKGATPSFTLREDLYVPVAQVGEAYRKKQRIVVLDARTPSDYLRLHIEGAVSVPYYNMKDLDRVPNDGTWVVAYCACPHHVSGIVVEELRKRGFKHTAVLDEGVFFWQTQGFPVVAAEGQLPVPVPPPNGPSPQPGDPKPGLVQLPH